MLIGFLIIITTILMDQLTKHISVALIALNQEIDVISPLFGLGHFRNYGMSFGALEGQHLLFGAVTLVSLLIFGYLFLDVDFRNKKVYSIGIALFIGGTFGNAIDRLLFGYVIDIFHFPFLTPVLNVFGLSNFYNNLADLALFTAIILFIIDVFIIEPKRKKKDNIKHEETV
ncbi:MAG: signal peptidase II [Acholeplasmataceae bacterium]|nr:signal peptidase II [Acholeplasmataceae bacterium]